MRRTRDPAGPDSPAPASLPGSHPAGCCSDRNHPRAGGGRKVRTLTTGAPRRPRTQAHIPCPRWGKPWWVRSAAFRVCCPERAPTAEGSRPGFATHRDLTWSGSEAAQLQQHSLLPSDWLSFGPSHIRFRVRGASSLRQPSRALRGVSASFPQCHRAGGPGGTPESRKYLQHTSVK